MKRLRSATTAALLLPVLTACSGWQSALDPKGPISADLARLIWFFTILCTAIWLLVMAALAIAVLRRRVTRDEPLPVDSGADRTATRVVSGAVAVTVLILVGLTALSFLTNRRVGAADRQEALTIRVTGHQWWWEVTYESDQPSRILTSANEIHIPLGEPVRLVLTSTDVIHSFWAPTLNGKRDLIPGRTNVLALQADVPGTFRAQCAEFCGAQHAHMALIVVAEPKASFEAWWDRQLRPAPTPVSEEAVAGRDVFLNRACLMCHRIQGTLAQGTTGPDLTHLASRATLAAGTLENTRGNLAAWIADPHGVKPGAHMPVVGLDGNELNAVVAYLEGLK